MVQFYKEPRLLGMLMFVKTEPTIKGTDMKKFLEAKRWECSSCPSIIS